MHAESSDILWLNAWVVALTMNGCEFWDSQNVIQSGLNDTLEETSFQNPADTDR